MKKIILLSISVFLLQIANCQTIEDKLNVICSKLSYKNLETELEAIFKNDTLLKDSKYTKDIKRELVKNYHEEKFVLEFWEPYNNNPSSYIIDFHEINLIRKNDIIIYYNLTKSKKIYSNKTEIEQLKFKYKNIYSSKLNLNKLFNSSVVYGDGCGYSGSKGEYRLKLNKFVKHKRKQKLLKWLSSPTTEIQLYAIDGIYQLMDEGIKFPKKTISVIEEIKKKDGFVNICNGCIYSKEEISKCANSIRAN